MSLAAPPHGSNRLSPIPTAEPMASRPPHAGANSHEAGRQAISDALALAQRLEMWGSAKLCERTLNNA